MKTVKRFTSFKDLKASESSDEATSVILTRHLAFERLISFIRSRIVRKKKRSRK